MHAVISELRTLDELRELERLFTAVWERPGVPAISSDTLTALAYSGNYVVGARAGTSLVGGLVAWLGGMPPSHLHLHSHILGVLPDSRVHGIGFDLKQHQRRWCLDRGVMAVEWTFDPLVRRNAYFNLTKLGADVSQYLVNRYGEMDDGINEGDESDRFLATWQLDSTRAEAAATGRPLEPAVDDLRKSGAEVLQSVGDVGEPVVLPTSAPVVLCQVPDDIVAIRRTNLALARAWRMAMRETMVGAIGAGYRVSGATHDGWYVLNRLP
jgi:predicted GNAT superfamily acetyltransferase